MGFVQVIRRIASILSQSGLWSRGSWNRGLWNDRRAVTSIEYVIIAIIIVTAIVGGLGFVGGYLSTDFNEVSSEL